MGLLGFLFNAATGKNLPSGKIPSREELERMEDPPIGYSRGAAKWQNDDTGSRDHSFLHNPAPAKIYDDGVRESWLGQAHTSPTHKLHKSGSTDDWQIDFRVSFKKETGVPKKERRIYEHKMGIDSLIRQTDESDEILQGILRTYSQPKYKFKPQPELTLSISPANPFKPTSLNMSNTDDDDSISRPFSFMTPLDIINPLIHTFSYEPPEDNRTLQQKIADMTPKMTHDCVSYVARMAQQRHDDLQERIRTAPSGYPLSTPHITHINSRGQSEAWTCGTPYIPKYDLQVSSARSSILTFSGLKSISL